jgi:nucleoid-associated protein YgaU
MAFWAELGTGGRAAILSLLGVVVVGGGYMLSQRGAETPLPEVSDVAPASSPESAAPAAAVPAAEVAAAPEAAEPVALISPTFDSWRVEADGAAVVAGKAEPSSTVRILVDGSAVAETTASPTGQFATLFTLPANDQPSLMSLEAVQADGTVLVSEAAVALEAIPGPAEPQIAAVAPEAAPAPAETAAEVTAEAAAVEVTADEVTADEVTALAEPAPEAAPESAAADVSEPEAPAPAPAAILVTEEGARVLQPKVAPDPEVVANVSLDAITYTPSGAVQVGGRGQPAQFVRIYLDNAPLVTALILDDGAWFSTLPEIAPGVYTVRVDQIDAAGKVTSRIETPFLRETREALASAMSQPTAEPAEAVTTEAGTAPETEATPPVVAEAAVPEDTSAAEATVASEEPVAPAEPEAAPEVVPDVADVAPASVPEPVVAETATEAPLPVAEPEPAPLATTEAAPAVESTAPEPLPVAVAEAPAAVRPVSITVQPGFTLWGIAEKEFGDGVLYVQVFEANKDKIRDPDLIYPGQVFIVPAGD